MNEKLELLEKIQSGHGTVEQDEEWLRRIKAIDPCFTSSDHMLSLERRAQARRKYEELRAQFGEHVDRSQLVQLVESISNSNGTDVEISAWLMLVEASVPHTGLSELIFHSQEPMTAEEIVDTALNYKPIALSGPIDLTYSDSLKQH